MNEQLSFDAHDVGTPRDPMSTLHPSDFKDSMTLGEARAKLRELVDEGHVCPCCTQFAKVYRRPLNAPMARRLVAFFKAVGASGEWFHGPSLSSSDGDTGKLALFGLVEEQREVLRPDGGRAGFWRITELGMRWLRGEAGVPSHARVYNKRLLELIGEPVTISDRLGEFDYRELMAGE